MIKQYFCVKITTTDEETARNLFKEIQCMKEDRNITLETFEYWTRLLTKEGEAL